MKKTGIITVTFNVPKLLKYQLKTLKKYCLDDYEFIVIDNSNDENHINEIKNICKENNISYTHKGFSVSVGNVPSTNHGLALNYAYETFKNKFDYLIFLDHDLFPIKPFSVGEMLGDNIIGGCEQNINNTIYLWPGFIMFSKLDETFDFTPNPHDTGCKLSGFINQNIDKVLFFDNGAVSIDLKLNNDWLHEFYGDIHNGTFMHFVKASNWMDANVETFNIRQNHLFGLLDEYIK